MVSSALLPKILDVLFSFLFSDASPGTSFIVLLISLLFDSASDVCSSDNAGADTSEDERT